MLKSVTPVSSPECFAFSFKISSVNGTFLDLAFAFAFIGKSQFN
jgi:hypothetical protein